MLSKPSASFALIIRFKQRASRSAGVGIQGLTGLRLFRTDGARLRLPSCAGREKVPSRRAARRRVAKRRTGLQSKNYASQMIVCLDATECKSLEELIVQELTRSSSLSTIFPTVYVIKNRAIIYDDGYVVNIYVPRAIELS